MIPSRHPVAPRFGLAMFDFYLALVSTRPKRRRYYRVPATSWEWMESAMFRAGVPV